MSLTASMWTGVSGMLAHGDKMNVIGNNIANVNTIAYKSQRMDFADLFYTDEYNNGGLNQQGHGVRTSTIITAFTQGPYEATSNPTDLAINGSGYFQVRKDNSDEVYYTRAGNFTFDKEGNLVDGNNYILQGWEIENSGGVQRATGGGLTANSDNESDVLGTGTPQDVKLDAFTIQPFATTNVTFITNLSAEGEDNINNNTNPFTGLFNTWDGTQPPVNASTPPIAQTAYEYSSPIEVYDEAGVKHVLTVYYDKVDSNDYQGGGDGEIWEYIVTMDPAEDQRQYFDFDPNNPEGGTLVDVSSTAMAGMLGSGTITFNSQGQATSQSFYTLFGSNTPESNPNDYHSYYDQGTDSYVDIPMMNTGGYVVDPVTGAISQSEFAEKNISDLDNWRTAEVSAEGYPMFVPNFTGLLDSQTTGSEQGAKHAIELNFGMKASNTDSPWSIPNGSLADLTVDPYEENQNYDANDPNGPGGPEYYQINEDYSSALLTSVRGELDTLRDQWEMGGYERESPAGSGVFVEISFTEIINGTYTAADIDRATGVQADGVTAATPASGAAIDTAIDGIALTGTDPTTGNPTSALRYNVNASATHAQQIAYIYNTDNSGQNVDRSIFEAATPSNATDLANFTKPVIIEDSAVQSQAGSSATYKGSQNGYPFGNLSTYYVDEKGVLSGVYDNGITMPLYQIVLYDFTSPQNLRREGGNVYSQTLDSGDPKSGPPNVAGLGSISSNSIEQSNVDLATEFVLMITTQRGFQGNSKVVTTVDTLLGEVINMKR